MSLTPPALRPLQTQPLKLRNMQMKMINLASVSRKKENNTAKHESASLKSHSSLNKVDEFKNIIKMRGTATRKQINKTAKSHPVKIAERNSFKQDFLKLRAPIYKSCVRQIHTEERVMTKSCEILFECIKPCKDIRIPRKAHDTESKPMSGILKTNAIIYERTATRKIKFLTVSEETPMECFLWNEHKTSLKPLPTGFEGFKVEQLQIQNEIRSSEKNITTEGKAELNETNKKTVSSEDFITNVFSNVAFI